MTEFEIFIKTLDDYLKVNGAASGKNLDYDAYKNYASNLYSSFGPFTLEEFQETDLNEVYWNYLLEPVEEDEVVIEQIVDNGESTVGTTVATSNEAFQNTQIWVRDGVKHVVWQVPGQPFFMRYASTDEEINQFFSGRAKPQEITVDDDTWSTSVFFGDSLAELPANVILQGTSPFRGFTELMSAAIDARPWLETDEELRNLWIQGLVEDRDITAEEWGATDWFENATEEVIDWLTLSKARGVDDETLPADAVALRDENRLIYTQKLKTAGVTNVDSIFDENTGKTFGQWFGDMVTTGGFTKNYAEFQVLAISDDESSIEVDSKVTDWLEGKGKLSQTKSGYATVQNTAYKWLGPLYGQLDSATQSSLAADFRNSETQQVGTQMLNDKFKAMRKGIFPTSMYDENLTYEEIATPWRNFTFTKLGERMSETSDVWLKILQSNDQTEASKLVTIYGLNNNNAKVFDTTTDDIATSLGISATGVSRGTPT